MQRPNDPEHPYCTNALDPVCERQSPQHEWGVRLSAMAYTELLGSDSFLGHKPVAKTTNK
jgi:hypothetical protein